MEVAPGVVVRERDRIKRGPKQNAKNAELAAMSNRNLRPVMVRAMGQTFSVHDLLGDQQPVIKPIADSPPIPPIMPHPPAQKAL